MAREIGFRSLVESYQKLKKWYLICLCWTLSTIRNVSRVKWWNPRKGVALYPTPWCSSFWKWSLWVGIDDGHQLYLLSYLGSNISSCEELLTWSRLLGRVYHFIEKQTCSNIYIYVYVSAFVCLFCFFGNSTFAGYLMPNPFYTYEQFSFKQISLA